MKIAINTSRSFDSNFSLSDKALDALIELNPSKIKLFMSKDDGDIQKIRSDPDIISVIEKLGDEAWGDDSKIEIIEIPDNTTDWIIVESDYGDETLYYVVDGKIRMKS